MRCESFSPPPRWQAQVLLSCRNAFHISPLTPHSCPPARLAFHPEERGGITHEKTVNVPKRGILPFPPLPLPEEGEALLGWLAAWGGGHLPEMGVALFIVASHTFFCRSVLPNLLPRSTVPAVGFSLVVAQSAQSPSLALTHTHTHTPSLPNSLDQQPTNQRSLTQTDATTALHPPTHSPGKI